MDGGAHPPGLAAHAGLGNGYRHGHATGGGSCMKTGTVESVRLDKWLWAARFFKTRSLATQEIDKGRVQVNGQVAKPARELHPGDLLELRQGPLLRAFRVVALSQVRGPAPVAQALYEETPESIARRDEAARQRRETP